MSETLVALIAASFGLIGTIVGSVATARATKAGANKSAEAMLTQVSDQANNEHGHWLRQQRLTAYEIFLDAWDECTRTRTMLARSSPATDEQCDSLREELRKAASRMLEQSRRLSLLGPDKVTQATATIAKATLANIEREDKFGRTTKETLKRLKGQQEKLEEIPDPPTLDHERIGDILASAHDIGELKEKYTIDELEEVVARLEDANMRIQKKGEVLYKISEIGKEAHDRAQNFLMNFERNIQVAEESRERFVRIVQDILTREPMPKRRDIHNDRYKASPRWGGESR
ncbi:hypothetical protein [Streptomyces cacaoi]|uniref:hypothetical protein n=1 Tax=Streptomyces cacaoi TaxID=1898 RepID=UPI0037488CF6